MNILLVSFDNSMPQATQNKLVTTLKSQSSWAKLTSNTYAVVTPLTPVQLRDLLNTAIGFNNRVIVYAANNRYWATTGMPKEVTDWLQNNWSQS